MSPAVLDPAGRSRRALRALTAAATCVAAMLAIAPAHAAAATCPNTNPIVDENVCSGPGTSAWQINDYSASLGGFTTETSVNLGDPVVLKIARDAPTTPTRTVTVDVFRMGHYGGLGGRLVHSASSIPINNDYTCRPMDTTTGKVDCGNWAPTYTIPGAALPATGIYLAKLTASTGEQTHVVFTVRDDDRTPASDMLYVLPMSTYQAYNIFGGKSLYYGIVGDNTVAGTGRAVKVSFNRPLNRVGGEHDWFFGPDFNLLSWLEQQGYDVSYTDDKRAAFDATSLRDHRALVISGHSEYWSRELFEGVRTARDEGVNVASFSANTAYWKVRYEDDGETLVCYKTVEGGGSGGSGSVSANDWGPDGLLGTADDALGPDGLARTADDRPENSTTTFRDDGAPPGDPSAPPGGRVGPDMPENQLFGVMYVGDNDSRAFPLTVPAANANGEYAGSRIWRNTGLPANSSTDIGTSLVGWEWDAVPAQPQYTSRQPAGVTRVAASDVQVAADNSWIQDEGRLRSTTPPPGQPGSVHAVEYASPSGARVFASGTMYWAMGLGDAADPRIQQATYNLIADMGLQPATPAGITPDPGGSNRAPVGQFTVSPNPTRTSQTVTFNAASSFDPDGLISRYEWDLDGDGSFETDTGAIPAATRIYASEGTVDVRLRVTDNGGATDLAVRTLTIIDNLPPTAAATASPNPVIAGRTVTLDGSASSDPDGSIAQYDWDLDGNGSFETSSGSNPTTTSSYASAGPVGVGLRVTDNGGKTATTTVPLTVSRGGVSNYGDTVLDTPGLLHYWRMGDVAGPALTDSKGGTPATAFGDPTFGVTGGPAADPDTAVRFDGSNDHATAAVDLSSTSRLTVEFWLKWSFANDDRLAMELTRNYHDNDGGFLIDPNAFQLGGTFAVGIGRNASRNTAFFTRPSSNEWHHYAFVLDATAPAAQQITPYVDGQAVSYTKLDSGTGAGNFANSTLHLMSRAGAALFGQGDLDEVAVFDRALSASTIADHFASYGSNRRPVARFSASPNPPRPGQQVDFDASASSDPDGAIVRYEWDLDGDGSFETDTGADPHASRSYASEGTVDVSLRVTDDLTGTDTQTTPLAVVQNQAPTAAFTADPNPAVLGQTTQFSAADSADPDGSVVRHEWDLDGDGTFETDTGASATTSRRYTAAGTTSVALRVTDDGGRTATSTAPVTVNVGGVSNYGDTVLDTPGLLHYWRMGEAAGPALADSRGTSIATASGGPLFGALGAVAGDPNTAVRFDGSDDSASADLALASARSLTVEFWLKWDAYANDDRLAMELTDNFNANAGGFLVDPNAPQAGGSFGVGIGTQATRNNAFFARPSAGQWHHYALVLDTTAAAAQQITPYVDGQAVSFTKLDSGTGAGAFANARLHLMSRAGQSLFGAGSLDEVAIYDRPLSAETIAEHFQSYGTNRRPSAQLAVSPSPAKPGQQVTFDASASADPDGTIVKYEWDLDGNGSWETDTGSSPLATRVYDAEADVNVRVRVFDDRNGTDVESHALTVRNLEPVASFTAAPNPASVGRQVAFDGSASTDADGTIVKYEWDLDGNGSFETDSGSTATTTSTYSSVGTTTVGLRVTDDGGRTAAASRPLTIVPAQQPPSAAIDADPNPVAAGQTVTFDASGSSDADGTIVRYEWDLDGNGSFETDTAAAPIAASAYPSPGTVPVTVRVTDDEGFTAVATREVDVNGTGTTYAQKVLNTGGLAHYWRMSELTGTTLADAKGQSHATLVGGTTLGALGALGGDPDRAASFDGLDDAAMATVDLSTRSRLTLEFWLKWNAYANDDRLAMELTPNFNDGPGGLLVDPNAPQAGGTFGIGIGVGASRNDAYFARPSAGQWHHYAIVLDSGAPAASQITPYVDGQPVAFTKTAHGTGAGSFANSQLYFMSRAASALFGAGALDELAIYKRPLTPSEIADHHDAGLNRPPTASFTATPTPAQPGETVAFDGSASTDAEGPIARYEWDLDGNGSFETDTGSDPTTTRSYSAAGTIEVALRVTDANGDAALATRSVRVNSPPSASFTVSPSPATTRQTVTFDGSGSSDADGSLAGYEWDLDGNGSFETQTGTNPTATRSYSTVGTMTIGLRVTDGDGGSAQTTRTLTTTSLYAQTVLGTAGLRAYWRLAETSGTSAADASPNNRVGTYQNTPTLNVSPLIAGEINPAVDFTRSQSERVNVPDNSLLDVANASLEAWVRPDSTPASGTFRTIIAKTGRLGVDLAYRLRYGRSGSANQLRFAVSTAGGTTEYTVGQTLTVGTTYHVVATYDGSAMRLYLNGEQLGSGLAKTGSIRNSGQSLRIGASSTSDYWDGVIDEPALYSAALAAATVSAHYDAGKP